MTATRRRLVRELRAISRDEDASLKALKISARQRSEVLRNRTVTTSPTMPAIDRYTGVVFDALDSASLSAEARSFAAGHVVIQSALLGPIGAMDPIPAYRLSHDSKLPGVHLAKTWAPLVPQEIAATNDLVLDFRSEAYVALSPLPRGGNSWFLRVVTESDDGSVRALNHFNKKAKGLLTRALLMHARDLATVDEVFTVAVQAGHRMEFGDPGEIRLFTSGV
ncbi:YaaA family protein [Agreia bicolorata]|uniref:YaaA family protein n=1 Tax=Agreia bicolorata TaxID=110935 RepID=UPI003082C86E